MDSDSFNPTPGRAEWLAPGVRRILAPNPSPMTYRGTNTYIVGQGSVAVIDPGPDSDAHLSAILAALVAGETVSHIAVTHSHLDHSPLAGRLAEATGAAIAAFGDSDAGQSVTMKRIVAEAQIGGGEGVDRSFHPDLLLADGDRIGGADWSLTALWTPGHMGNHLSFASDDAIFTGDLIMGWATSMVSPPDGDLTQFLTSCTRLARRPERRYYPGHGAPVGDGPARATELIRHRQKRSDEIIAALREHPDTLEGLTARVYAAVDPVLLPAAARNVFAHIIDLEANSRVTALPSFSPSATFHLSDAAE